MDDRAIREGCGLLLAAVDGDLPRLRELIGGLDVADSCAVLEYLALFGGTLIAECNGAGAARAWLAGEALRLAGA